MPKSFYKVISLTKDEPGDNIKSYRKSPFQNCSMTLNQFLLFFYDHAKRFLNDDRNRKQNSIAFAKTSSDFQIAIENGFRLCTDTHWKHKTREADR